MNNDFSIIYSWKINAKTIKGYEIKDSPDLCLIYENSKAVAKSATWIAELANGNGLNLGGHPIIFSHFATLKNSEDLNDAKCKNMIRLTL